MINKAGKQTTTKPWDTKAWKEMRGRLLKDRCKMCGSTEKPFVLHHIKGKVGGKKGFAQYMDPKPTDVQTLCKPCHMRITRGYVLCKQCGKEWHKSRWRVCYKCAGSPPSAPSVFEMCHRWGARTPTFEVECLECELRTGEDEMGQTACPEDCKYLIPPSK